MLWATVSFQTKITFVPGLIAIFLGVNFKLLSPIFWVDPCAWATSGLAATPQAASAPVKASAVRVLVMERVAICRCCQRLMS